MTLTRLVFVSVSLTDYELKIKLQDLAIKESVPTPTRLEKLKWEFHSPLPNDDSFCRKTLPQERCIPTRNSFYD